MSRIMPQARILVLDDDEFLRSVVSERLEREGHEVVVAGTMSEAREAVRGCAPDVALLDVKLPDGEGTELLEPLSGDLDAACVMITAHATVESAVEALKKGAVDYLEKPLNMERLLATVSSALELTSLRREVRALREERGIGEPIVAESPEMEEVLSLVERVAPADSATVLIQGETGTGKGIVARAIHRLSPRRERPYVTVTCSALPEKLLESELFGHEKGAFTDAHTLKRGLVEVAEGGTLFLDEVAELPHGVQATLLRFIEERTFRRVGGTEDLRVDVRLLAATNRDLEREVEEERFRSDLYYRLSVVPVHIPPLRQRPDDVPALAKHFLEHYNNEFGKRVRRISPEAMDLLESYRWPGNVREIRNVIERGVLLADDDTFGLELLPPEVRSPGEADRRVEAPELGEEGVDLESLEETLLREALRRAGGNRSEAGRLLGLSRHQIRRRIEKYEVEE